MILTIAICTRNRPKELERCLYSVASQENIKKAFIEILIIDDGELSFKQLHKLKTICEDFHFSYHKKEKRGLFLSRLKAIELSKSDKILFLDDDTVIENGYIANLLKTYKEFENVSAVGGVDLNLPEYSFFRKLYATIFLYYSPDPSKLSLSMMNSSMYKWREEKEPFKSEYLDGCNMSFKKEALKDVEFQEYFNDYSLGEDIFFSLWAGRKGEVIVNPKMKVRHLKSPLSRDKTQSVAFMKVVNHYKLLKYSKRGKYKYITVYWTYIGYLLASLLKLNIEEIKGYTKGIKYLVLQRV